MAQRQQIARSAAPPPGTVRRRRLVAVIVGLVLVAIIAIALLLALRTPPHRSVIVGGFGPSPVPTAALTVTPTPTAVITTPTNTPPTQTPIVLVATPTAVVIDRGGVIAQITDTLRLETETFVGERVIEASRLDGSWKDTLYGERILLIASGKTIAGVDLQKVHKEDIIISSDGLSITLNLPATEILVNTLDNQRTRRYSTQSGWLADNPDLETEARQTGEAEILKAACEAGIMEKSARSIKTNMTGFLRMLRFERVTVNVTAGPCVAPPANPDTTITPSS
jgi:hypothetical protein